MQRLYALATAVKGSVTQSSLARELNTSSQRVKNWEARGLSREGAMTAGELFGVNPNWLRDGTGPVPAVLLSTASPTESERSVHIRESVHEIAPGYVRLGLLDAAGDMGDGAENVDFPEVIREMDLAEGQLRNLIGFLPRPNRLKLMTGRGISMEPVIKSGDVVIVDTGIQHFDGDGIYVVNTGSGVQIKALQDRGDGLYVVSANSTFPAYKAAETLIIGGKVYVRNRLERLD